MDKVGLILRDLLRGDGFIHVSKALIFAIGNDAALIYSELLSRHGYFETRGMLTGDGYFFNTIEDLYGGTGLSVFQQRKGIGVLQKVGLIDMEVRGIPPKRYFKILDVAHVLSNLLLEGQAVMKEQVVLGPSHELGIMGVVRSYMKPEKWSKEGKIDE